MLARILTRTLKAAIYAGAGLVILLAILVGLFRLFLPRLPEYQEDIKTWASEAIGMQVEFDAMDARWGLRGPELKFYEAELIRTTNNTRAVAASEVGVGARHTDARGADDLEHEAGRRQHEGAGHV